MIRTACLVALFSVLGLISQPSYAQTPIVGSGVVVAEQDGMVAVEAEHFFEQTQTKTRAFYLVTSDTSPDIKPDGDPPHVGGASGGAYLEILPDTRRTHADKLITGVNFSPQPGKMAVLHYKVQISNPGRYYVWVRAYSSGSEDNGLHVGIDGQWPASGQRLQWCEGKNSWRWDSKQRTEKQHCGEPYKIYLDIDKPGQHIISFSMREDGFEFDKWLMTTNRNFARPDDAGPTTTIHRGKLPKPFPTVAAKPVDVAKPAENSRNVSSSPTEPVSSLPKIEPRGADGKGDIVVSGDAMVWHKVTLTLDGPFAHEQDNQPNPFTDYGFSVEFRHDDGTTYNVPGYFAADGDAANTSAESGTKWRVHFAPDRAGRWTYTTRFVQGKNTAVDSTASATPIQSCDSITNTIKVSESNKTGDALLAQGRLQYVGKRYLQHAGSKRFFLKAGADAPETLLAYTDFDNTIAGKAEKVPLKSWQPHVADWNAGDPTWKEGKGKGLIGAVNYLAGKGCNAFSFLTYNAGGDGDNVWPFIDRNDKMHYDCSKLDQWGIVFDHGTQKSMYLHFKLQETEIDDHNKKNTRFVPESLDGGNLGPQRKLYLRELIARFGHNLALNWNLGEENTQTTAQQQAMINYIADTDPYDHHIVIHTFPDQQKKVYQPLLGNASNLTGVSLQNSGIHDTHWQTVFWVEASTKAGKPWVVAFDESGTAAHGQCPDIGYKGYDGKDSSGKDTYTEHDVRRQTLWGSLMGGGAGVEYYFGYKYIENDLVCEDWRSRDRSWDYCRIALNFFRNQNIPFVEMVPSDSLVGMDSRDNACYCLAKPGEIYLVFLATADQAELDLSDATGEFTVEVFNPRTGEFLVEEQQAVVPGGYKVTLAYPSGDDEERLIVLRKTN
ncbi:hypothetical protein CA13_41910 [Planctomycetes bacterium CA13]|uniref:DUF5060 domain-containing protein n=1 Tax=Novipirellula herctigrandis TaxID=2527986 RepID=A0A5C5Z601_9BACT|nr:hypothetical protein CA13_41910 [Planctomycetes bacterium CA13]